MIRKIQNYLNIILATLLITILTQRLVNNIKRYKRIREENKLLEELLDFTEQNEANDIFIIKEWYRVDV